VSDETSSDDDIESKKEKPKKLLGLIEFIAAEISSDVFGGNQQDKQPKNAARYFAALNLTKVTANDLHQYFTAETLYFINDNDAGYKKLKPPLSRIIIEEFYNLALYIFQEISGISDELDEILKDLSRQHIEDIFPQEIVEKLSALEEDEYNAKEEFKKDIYRSYIFKVISQYKIQNPSKKDDQLLCLFERFCEEFVKLDLESLLASKKKQVKDGGNEHNEARQQAVDHVFNQMNLAQVGSDSQINSDDKKADNASKKAALILLQNEILEKKWEFEKRICLFRGGIEVFNRNKTQEKSLIPTHASKMLNEIDDAFLNNANTTSYINAYGTAAKIGLKVKAQFFQKLRGREAPAIAFYANILTHLYVDKENSYQDIVCNVRRLNQKKLNYIPIDILFLMDGEGDINGFSYRNWCDETVDGKLNRNLTVEEKLERILYWAITISEEPNDPCRIKAEISSNIFNCLRVDKAALEESNKARPAPVKTSVYNPPAEEGHGIQPH
jgi:hypothetical protein